MTTGLISFCSNLFNPVRLTGPIFDKELRVSSRRRRNYFLRFGYVVLLSIFILSVWYSTFGISSSGSTLYQVSRLSQLGRNVIITIVWFQFVVAQLIAVIMLSSAISDEIHTGTLSVLMTTPINSFQIVTGKLLSKLLQLMLLLAVSLPLLAIIRIFGGVPWDYIISSVCITVTAAVFAGSLSLLLSMSYRYAYSVVLVTIVGYMLIFGALPGLLTWLAAKGAFSQQVTGSILALINPFWAMAATTQRLSTPSFKIVSWPVHCLITLGATAVLLAIAVWRVRKVALCEAFGKNGKYWSDRTSKGKRRSDIDNTDSLPSGGPIKPVTGLPIVWKEMRKGFIGHSKGDVAIYVSLIVTFFITAVLLLFSSNRNIILPYYFMYGLYLVVMIRLAVLSAGSITIEKEARTLPILLATPLDDKEIIRGKAIAAFRRNIPLLLLYFVLLCIFYIRVGMLEMSLHLLISLIFAALGLLGSILFVIGSGLYFGVRLRTTTAAVAATVGSYLAMKYLLCGMFNPLRILFYTMVIRSYGATNPGIIHWASFAMTIIFGLMQAGIGLFLARRAVRRLRHNIF